MTIERGDIVRIADNWLNSKEEAQHRYVVLEAYADVQRCLIECITTNMVIRPTERVTFDMVVKVDSVKNYMEE